MRLEYYYEVVLGTERRTTYVGLWWLPDKPDHRMHGTLTIGRRHPELELYDSIVPRDARDGDRFDPPVFHGRSMGSCLTLLANLETGSATSRRGGYEEIRRHIMVGTVLIGDTHLESEDGCRFNRASLRLANMDEWVNRTPYRWAGQPADSVQLLELPTLKASIPCGEVLLCRETTLHKGRLTDSGFSSHEVIELHLAEQVALEELEYRFIRPLGQLLTLAAGTHCDVLELRVGNDDGSDRWQGNWPFASFALRRRDTNQDQSEPPVVRPHMRFGMNCDEYPPNINFGDIVPRWYELQKELAPVCDLIFSLYSDVGGYLQQQIFTIASAVEALHRSLNPGLEEKTDEDRSRNKAILAAAKAGSPDHHQWLAGQLQYAHRRSYVFRVRELLQDTGHLMATIVGDEEKWAQQLREFRDGIGHVLPSQEEKTVDQMVAMLYSARLFAEVALLRQLGFSDAECRRSLEHHWERENVRAKVEKGFPEWFSDPTDPAFAGGH